LLFNSIFRVGFVSGGFQVSRLRLLVLILGPLPIVAASMALSGWARSSGPSDVHFNDISGEPSAGHDFETIEGDSQPPSDLREPCQNAAALLKHALGPECRLIVRPPFIIAGDLEPAELDRWNRETIAPAARAMAHCYFRSTPDEPITVLLFRGEESYNHYAHKLFGESGISIYGYYKPRRRTLLMNIGTGGGTLVHELTHALIDFDFPQAPDWFNEGLASLHEQCRFREDSSGPWIEGLENWRLAGLQKSIRSGNLQRLSSMIERPDFHGRMEGVNYAQARYLCLYLQCRGLLRPFYTAFRKNQATDPSGLKTLAALFPAETWQNIDKEFQAWALKLE